MLIRSTEVLEQIMADGTLVKNQEKPKRVLMCSPNHFAVEYAINPFMKDEKGELNVVNVDRAIAQWNSLKSGYEAIGIAVDVLPGAPGLPDMVFAANQSFPFRKVGGEKSVVLSRMRSQFRRGEVPFFRDWYERQGYRVREVPENTFFEGNGDALVQYPWNLVWGGYGHRSSLEAYNTLLELGLHVVPLELNREHHYHLDLCLSIINETTAVVFPEAFSAQDYRMLQVAFPNLIEVDAEENLRYACCNCHSPDGQHVFTHAGAEQFRKKLTAKGLTPIEVDTSEFLKSGGSVFCMKMMVF